MGSYVALGSSHKANAVGFILTVLLFVQVHDVHLLVPQKRNNGEIHLGAALHVMEHLLADPARQKFDASCRGSQDRGQHVHCEEEMLHDVLTVQLLERGPSLEESMRLRGVLMLQRW